MILMFWMRSLPDPDTLYFPVGDESKLFKCSLHLDKFLVRL